MRWPRRVLAATLAVLLIAAVARAATAGAASPPADLDEVERQRILAHGPWPPPARRDAGNGVAGRPAAQALGQRLFFDRALSPDGRVACVDCHLPQRAFTDGRARSVGRAVLDRNAPSLWNAVHERWLGWDGAADSLWSQALRPLLDERELGSSAAHLRRRVAASPELSCRWRAAFGSAPPDDDDRLLVQTGKALGAFVATLVSGRTPFDRVRDALASGDTAAQARYPAAAWRGLRLFVGRGRCSLCHAGAHFSHGEFADIGAGFFVRPGVVDPGRHGGIVALQGSRFNLLSAHADDAGEAAVKTRHVDLQHRHFGEFKVPSLRNVAETAPYLHDGRFATLAEVVRHYSELDLDRLHADGESLLQPLHLDQREAADLVAFLRTLSDAGARRWQPPRLPRCG